MKSKNVLFILFVISLFLASACSKNEPTGYAGYNPQQQEYVGGGCGVVPMVSYEETPIEELTASGNMAV